MRFRSFRHASRAGTKRSFVEELGVDVRPVLGDRWSGVTVGRHEDQVLGHVPPRFPNTADNGLQAQTLQVLRRGL